MGSWGYGPYDNDTAGDLTDTVLSPLLDKFTSKDHLEARAAISLFFEFHKLRGWTLDQEHREAAVERLTRILKDKKFVNDWSKPDVFRLSVEKEIRSLL